MWCSLPFFFPPCRKVRQYLRMSVEVKLWFKMLSSQKETLEEFLGYIIKTLIFHEEWLSNNKNKLKVQLLSFEQESFTWKLTTKNFIKLDCSKTCFHCPLQKYHSYASSGFRTSHVLCECITCDYKMLTLVLML